MQSAQEQQFICIIVSDVQATGQVMYYYFRCMEDWAEQMYCSRCAMAWTHQMSTAGLWQVKTPQMCCCFTCIGLWRVYAHQVCCCFRRKGQWPSHPAAEGRHDGAGGHHGEAGRCHQPQGWTDQVPDFRYSITWSRFRLQKLWALI